MSDPKGPDKNVSALLGMLGFDPSKPNAIPTNAFEEALKELKEEDTKQRKVKAKELLTKAATLYSQWKKVENDFGQQKAKFDKEFGKLMNTIGNYMRGQEEAPQQESEKTE
jgi:threonyl-tRNA synthetase